MDNPLPPPSQKPKRFFDIVPANKTVPDSSSRPILVTNQPEQTDPMVKAEPAVVAEKPKSSDNQGSITVAEAMESASEPIKMDTPPEAKPVEVAADATDAPTPDASPKTDTSADNVPADETPAQPPEKAVVVRHGWSSSTIRNIVLVFLILIMLTVIADLILDIGYIKSGMWHTHFFAS